MTRRRIQEIFVHFLRNGRIQFSVVYDRPRLGFEKVSSDNVYYGESTKLWKRRFANFFPYNLCVPSKYARVSRVRVCVFIREIKVGGGSLLCLYIGKVVSLGEVRCFSVRNVSTSEGYLRSLGVQPPAEFFCRRQRTKPFRWPR